LIEREREGARAQERVREMGKGEMGGREGERERDRGGRSWGKGY
jgi:hypothetical protein